MSHPALNDLLKLADQCVKCGLCLSDCPSYRLYQSEADSPRGRITLAQTLLQQEVVIAKTVVLGHFDRCLGCGRCEQVCPSLVHYQDLIDETRYRFSLSSVPKWQLAFFSRADYLKLGLKLSNNLPNGFKPFLPGIFRAASKINLAMQSQTTISADAFAVTENKGTIALFTGCVGQVIDASAIEKTRLLLEHIGYSVVTPASQTCCGAMHQHEGYIDDADELVQKNHIAFSEQDCDAVLYFASGCATQLKKIAKQENINLLEATTFIGSLPEIQPLSDNIPSEPVVLHIPCTQLNKTETADPVRQVIKSIAKQGFQELADNHVCCGSAGLHQLKLPDSADKFMRPKVLSLKSSGAATLLTSNTGCALHFRQAIDAEQIEVQVMHPAEWISDLYFANLAQ